MVSDRLRRVCSYAGDPDAQPVYGIQLRKHGHLQFVGLSGHRLSPSDNVLRSRTLLDMMMNALDTRLTYVSVVYCREPYPRVTRPRPPYRR